jgi:hypothetical protein
MQEKEKIMAAITAAIDMFEEEEAQTTQIVPRPKVASNWKYWGVGEMMRMRTLWQLRLCTPASIRRR